MKTVRLAVLAYPGCMPTQLFGIADVLRVASDIAQGMGKERERPVTVELIGLNGRQVTVAGGQAVQVKPPAGRYDLLIVPGLEIQRPTDWSARLAPLSPEVAFIRRRFARGTAVASV
jgi:putative intracellular protease/amidase